MANMKVNVAGVEFPNPVIVGSASPSMDWVGTVKGIGRILLHTPWAVYVREAASTPLSH